MNERQFRHKVIKKRSFRIKKAKKYRERDMKKEAEERVRRKKAACYKKIYLKRIKRISALQQTYEGWWLDQWCHPNLETLPLRKVTSIGIDFDNRQVIVTYGCGYSHPVNTDSVWPSRDDLKIMEVEYNEKGNILHEM